jgi:osmotically-inducible protein OsmY
MGSTNLAKDVLDELLADKSLDASRINVTVDGNNVALSGSVRTFHEKDDAGTDTWRVRGVHDVKNELVVDTDAERVLDNDLASAGRAGLDANGLVPKGSVTLAASDGWVTMTGTVAHGFQRAAAEHVVRHLRGLQGFTDNVTVEKQPPKDLAERVSAALGRNGGLGADHIRVSGADGVVTLAGTVRTGADRQEAERAAWRTDGVVDVKNKLVVRK